MAVLQFENAFKNFFPEGEILISDEPTKTAQQAADVHGVPVSAIVKSILLKSDDEFVLFLVPGDKRIDLEIAAQKLSARNIRMATPEEVKLVTGYSIGGVPPFGHNTQIRTIIWEGFPEKGMVVPAAGAGNAVFKIDIIKLKQIIETHT